MKHFISQYVDFKKRSDYIFTVQSHGIRFYTSTFNDNPYSYTLRRSNQFHASIVKKIKAFVVAERQSMKL